MEDNIDKIRELLFGDQMKTLEEQLGTLEEKLVQRLASVESKLADNAEQISRQLESEKTERHTAIDKMEKAVGDLFSNLNHELNKLREQNDQHFTASKQSLDTQISKLESDIRSQKELLQRNLDESLGQINNDKVSRDKLAALFGNLSKMLDDSENK